MTPPPFGRRNPANMPVLATAARAQAPSQPMPRPPEIAPKGATNWAAIGADLFFNPNGRLSLKQYRSVRGSMLVLFAAFARLASLACRTTTPTAANFGYVLAMFAAILLVAGLFFGCGVVLTIKRWHDLDKPAAWALIGCIPVAGWIFQLLQCNFTAGTSGANRYGPPPTWR